MQENFSQNNQNIQNGQNKQHTLTVEQRKKIVMTGVESVNSFSPQQINLTVDGGKMTITGNDLKITNFSKTSGAFSAIGEVTSIKYGGGGLMGLFK